MGDNPYVDFEGETYWANCDHENEVGLDKKQQLFRAFINKYSLDKDKPFLEWEYLGNKPNMYDGSMRCICSKHIKTWNLIKNKNTGLVLIIGSECVKTHFDGIVRCKTCGSSLRNVIKRMKTQTLVCPKCQRETQNLADRRYYMRDRLYRFSELVEDMELMTEACNMPQRDWYERGLFKKWQRYLELLGWEIYDLPQE